jgi:hypothetical protein
MKKVEYKLDKSGNFIIENYNRAKAFSSFFPGIAGLQGIPLWVFYVNRGQCVCSFGTKDRDGAILEFLPANQAYNLTSIKGFRTFLKLKRDRQLIFYEPFREEANRTSDRIFTKMTTNPFKLEIEEVNSSLGIRINISYITIPNEFFAGLARKVTIANISKKSIEIELIDGLPQVIPFGMTEWCQKHMSRTIEAWMRVSNIANNAPFYSLKIDPQDRPELEYIERGNFYMAFQVERNKTSLLKPIIDPDIVFGKNGDISYPRIFAGDKHPITLSGQKSEGITPSAFTYTKFVIKAGQDKKIVSIIGNTKDVNSVNEILRKIKSDVDYFEQKLSENEDIITRVQNSIFTKSSSNEFDFYARQTFLDNLLRGGFPVSIETSKGPFVFYAYARKHGDLERDYNAFLLQPSYYSQGNGAYRDINQNRRNDAFFNPDVKDENILTFMNAIQPDGFNPHLIEGISLSIKNRKLLDTLLRKYIKSISHIEKMKKFLLVDFTPGTFIFFLEKEQISSKEKADRFLKEILAISAKEDVVMPGEGYWVDHWTYNIDLFESYLSCYPEKLKELFLDKKQFTFYDTYLRVAPRSEKYVYINGKVRQFGSVVEDEEKKRMLEARPDEPYKVRTNLGKGKVYKTNLLTKLICVIANKIASLDPFGIGIEMEAEKPGWCDGLNGLPGIFGSSLCEVFELKRLINFINSSFSELKIKDDYKIALSTELSDFLIDLEKLVNRSLSSKSKRRDYIYWDSSCGRKEQYRKQVWFGVSGKEKSVSIKKIKEILDKFLLKIEISLKKGFSKKDGMTYSYYINEVKRYSLIYEKGKNKLNKDGLPVVKALSFSHKPLSIFLEGPMHAMRVIGQKEAKSLYNAIRNSKLFDKKLKMYKINEPLNSMPLEIGRSTVFTPGWLENESVWLHMEYKYLLELLKRGLYEEFFSDLKNCLIAFQDPSRYGRSIFENSSFLASSAYPDKDVHGNGFVARLTGSTTEFLTMWRLMCLGKNPFVLDEKGKLRFEPAPILPGWLFTEDKSVSYFYFKNGAKESLILPKDIFAFCLFGKTVVVYHNPKRHNTFGKNAVQPTRMTLKKRGEPGIRFNSSNIHSPYALKIRDGFYDIIDIELA